MHQWICSVQMLKRILNSADITADSLTAKDCWDRKYCWVGSISLHICFIRDRFLWLMFKALTSKHLEHFQNFWHNKTVMTLFENCRTYCLVDEAVRPNGNNFVCWYLNYLLLCRPLLAIWQLGEGQPRFAVSRFCVRVHVIVYCTRWYYP